MGKPSTLKTNHLLTPRQRQVIEQVSNGMSNKEIANELGISEGTVKQHIFAIFKLVNVSSRAKLALVGQRLDPHVDGQRINTLASPKASLQYSWRLISALAVCMPVVAMVDPKRVVQRNQKLVQLRFAIDQMVEALDGRSMPLPDGGVLVWFGYPTSHIDDPERATLLAQGIRKHMEADSSMVLGSEPESVLGLGIATVAEVVPGDSSQLISAKAFADALQLGKKSCELGLTLANGLSRQLCKASIPWLELRPKNEKDEASHPRANQSIYAISNKMVKLSLPSSAWGELPFLPEVFETARNGIAQWLSVESWPPTLANSLIDAVGIDAQRAGFFPIRLHLPSTKRQEAILSSLVTQIEMMAGQFDLPPRKNESLLDRLLSIIWKVSSQVPLVIQVYGIQSMGTLKTALGTRGIDRLVGLRALVTVANVRDSQKPKTSIRVLGARPDNVVFTRVHTMTEPDLDLLPEGVMVDMQAMVDDLSSPARQIIFAAAEAPDKPTDELLPRLSIPRPVMQMALQELSNAGLIIPRGDNHFDFRDAMTISAIVQLKKVALAN